MVVGLTVWPAVSFEEVTGAELLLAMTTGEVLWMPDLAEGCDHLQPVAQ